MQLIKITINKILGKFGFSLVNSNFYKKTSSYEIVKSLFRKNSSLIIFDVGAHIGFTTKLYRNLKVFHKRRVSLSSFIKQVYKFGVARSILNNRYPKTKKIIYWFPLLFSCVFLISIFLFLFKISNLILIIYLLYFLLIFVQSSFKNNPIVGLISIITTLIQFIGYGYGFFRSFVLINILPNKKIESIFPNMFFNHN